MRKSQKPGVVEILRNEVNCGQTFSGGAWIRISSVTAFCLWVRTIGSAATSNANNGRRLTCSLVGSVLKRTRPTSAPVRTETKKTGERIKRQIAPSWKTATPTANASTVIHNELTIVRPMVGFTVRQM